MNRAFFARSVHEVAPELVGVTLLVDGIGGKIVEVEAYDHEDPAAHGYAGETERNASMFGPPGHAYVYRSYGIHWCLNFVCGEEGVADAVLIRALEPTAGIAEQRRRRGTEARRSLCSGPGKLTEALGVGLSENGASLGAAPFAVLPREGRWREAGIETGRRIGITKATELPWRFCAAGSRFVSRPWPAARAA